MDQIRQRSRFLPGANFLKILDGCHLNMILLTLLGRSTSALFSCEPDQPDQPD
jgi:hypothetical protein